MRPAERKRFEDELKRVVRRRERLAAALSGSAEIERVPVKECVVHEHTRGEHTRLVVRLKKRPRRKTK